jgi:hypothetical protein
MAEGSVDTALNEGARVANPTLPTKVRDPEMPVPCPSGLIVARPGVADQQPSVWDRLLLSRSCWIVSHG